jgi:hypothetical protein
MGLLRNWGAASVLAAAGLLFASPGWSAEPDAPTVSAAAAAPEAATSDAARLVDAASSAMKRRDFDGAIVQLWRAERLAHHPTIVFRIAEAEQARGHWLKARSLYRRVLADERTGSDAEVVEQAQARAREALRRLEARMPKLRIAVEGDVGSDIRLTIDGQPLDRCLWHDAVDVDPGEHVLVMHHDGSPQRRTVNAIPTQTRQVRWWLADPPPATGYHPGAPRPRAAKKDDGLDARVVTGLALFGAGVVGTGTLVWASSSDPQDETAAIAGAVALPATLIFATGGVIMLSLGLSDDAGSGSGGDVAVLPIVGPGYGGAGLSARF